MTVRVANDLKTEAQGELQRLVLENKQLRDKIKALEIKIQTISSMYFGHLELNALDFYNLVNICLFFRS